MVGYTCPFCNFYCQSKAGVNQHIQAVASCLQKQKQRLGMTTQNQSNKRKQPPAAVSLPAAKKSTTVQQSTKQAALLEQLSPEQVQAATQMRQVFEEDAQARAQLFGQLDKTSTSKDNDLEDHRKMPAQEENEEELTSDDGGPPPDSDDDRQNLNDPAAYFAAEEAAHLARTQEEVRQFMLNDNVPLNPTLAHAQQQQQQQDVLQGLLDDDYNNDRTINANPNTEMRDNFRKFCAVAANNYMPELTKRQKKAVKLLHVLKQKKAPLDTYGTIMEWHYRDKGYITDRESLKDVRGYVSRPVIMDIIKHRYNMQGKFATNVPITLPVSKAKVTITKHSAWDCFESLLTDPRVNDSDYNFVNNNPFAPPAPQGGEIGDFHTARAHRVAYEKYITDPTRQVLMPVQMYIDGACTGQFQNLPITALKMALGIHTRKFRANEHAWRTLGYVAQVSKFQSRGKAIFVESEHIEAVVEDISEEEGERSRFSMFNKAQDFHAMLEEILKSYLEVQQNGFIWDLRYRGKTYKNIEFVPYVVFVKCDTDEGDLLCGSFKTRTGNVKNLCRYCTCPTLESSLVNAKFPYKTVSMIKPSILIGDEEGLKAISQQLIDNAWYKVRFSPENSRGIHGATPMEMLHHILLGVFKYIRDCFFEQIGPTSQLANEINALSQKYGVEFGRQAGRDLPKCKFKNGIRKGKIMAKEFRGVLLAMAAVLRSDKGVSTLKSKKAFKHDHVIKDWLLLIEMVLEWEAYLCEPVMKVTHVMRMQKKNRYIMYLLKRVGKRQDGMGFNLMKFHAISHLAWDIILYGIPLEVDTGFNESHHKITKVAARLTQKNESTFDFQTSTRLDEFLTIDLAIADIEGKKMWDYYRRKEERPRKRAPKAADYTGGAHIWVYRHPDDSEKLCYGVGKRKPKNPSSRYWCSDLLKFLVTLQEKLVWRGHTTGDLEIRGEHHQDGIPFRGHPQYRDHYWRDWALFNWCDQIVPAQIWCFVVIDCIPINDGVEEVSGIEHGGKRVKNGAYAVVERCEYEKDKKKLTRSDIFVPMRKIVKEVATKRHPWKRKFYLMDVKDIVQPIAVVPNIGGKSKRDFFVVKQRSEWVEMFEEWLEEPHSHDEIGDEEPVPSHILDYTY